MVKHIYKHKVLLDENMPPRIALTNCNQLFDIKHIRFDLRKPGLVDHLVYEHAVSLGRIVITYNTKDFKPLAGTKEDQGIIAVPPSFMMNLSQLDTKLTAFLKKSKPIQLQGKCISLLEEVN